MSRASRLAEAISKIQDGMDEIRSLADEISEWRGNLEGTNLENTQKYSELQECEDGLNEAAESIEAGVNDLENIEFPQMYG